MKKLTINIIYFSMLVLACMISLYFLPKDNGGYFSANLDKMARLHGISTPKIIIIGGSNVAFSLDSKTIEKRTDKKVVNMGLHIGIGLRTMLNEIKPGIKSGDLIIIQPEYELYAPSKDFEEAILTLDGNPYFLKYIPVDTWPSLLRQLPILYQYKIKTLLGLQKPGKIFERAAFNEYGDHISHLNMPTKSVKKFENVILFDIDKKNLDSLLYIKNYANALGAKVVIRFPPVSSKYYANNKEQIKSIEKILIEQEFQVVNKPEDQVYEDNDFFDANYHLLSNGRNKNTLKLVSNIQNLK